MELKSLKMDLVEELLSLNDKEMLNRVKNYLKRLKKMEAEKEMEEITKEEILAGIDAGLKDVKAGRTRSAYELLDEL
jgi:predicted transcriptional regulator